MLTFEDFHKQVVPHISMHGFETSFYIFEPKMLRVAFLVLADMTLKAANSIRPDSQRLSYLSKKFDLKSFDWMLGMDDSDVTPDRRMFDLPDSITQEHVDYARPRYPNIARVLEAKIRYAQPVNEN